MPQRPSRNDRNPHSPLAPPKPVRVQRRSLTPATLAMVVFMVLAMLRVLVFRPESFSGPANQPSVTVKDVIDGDTFDLTDGRRVRLLGIDAPEAGFDGKVPDPWSEESTAWLRERVEGKSVTLQIGEEEKDRYGRTLAWVFDAEGLLINRQMLAEGQARLLPDFGLPANLEPSLREAESEARLLKRGLWGISGRPRQPLK